ncbi:MAG: D-alanine transaminase [Rickettsiales bacterium]|jgi:D-alanine transaminase
MIRVSFVNGEFQPHDQCFVHIEDRGFQFADGIYEVILLKNNKLIDVNWHLDRLFYSLGELNIKIEKSRNEITKIILDLFLKNNLNEGSIYLQITRGKSPRQQGFPKNYPPTIVATVLPLKNADSSIGLKVITHQDLRWNRCDIKSIGLAASSMIRQKAFDQNSDDAILIRDGFVTEATFANVFIVDENGFLITRDVDNLVLNGITKKRIIQLAQENGIGVVERKFTLEELLKAKEVFLTSSTLFIRSVIKIDDKIINNEKIGETTQSLSSLYQEFIENHSA